MPEQMMCPMRSDAKTARHCEPDRCMWGQSYDYEDDGRCVRLWMCAVFRDDSGFYRPNGVPEITTREDQ